MERFIYFIGCGVAFMMFVIAFYGSSERIKKEKGKEIAFKYVLLSALACCWLSWAVPVWYIGNVLFAQKKSK